MPHDLMPMIIQYRYGGEAIEEYLQDEATEVISLEPSASGKVWSSSDIYIHAVLSRRIM